MSIATIPLKNLLTNVICLPGALVDSRSKISFSEALKRHWNLRKIHKKANFRIDENPSEEVVDKYFDEWLRPWGKYYTPYNSLYYRLKRIIFALESLPKCVLLDIHFSVERIRLFFLIQYHRIIRRLFSREDNISPEEEQRQTEDMEEILQYTEEGLKKLSEKWRSKEAK